jgi:hypothetical protein
MTSSRRTRASRLAPAAIAAIGPFPAIAAEFRTAPGAAEAGETVPVSTAAGVLVATVLLYLAWRALTADHRRHSDGGGDAGSNWVGWGDCGGGDGGGD